MDFFLYSFLYTCYFILSGFGLTLLLIPKQLEKYTLFFSPFVGLVYVTYLSTLFIEFGNWGSNVYVWVILILSIIITAIALMSRKHIFCFYSSYVRRVIFQILCICIIIFFVLSFPYYSNYDGLINTISLGNNDIISYATAAKYAMVSSFNYSPIPYVPEVTPGFNHILRTDYVSAIFATALPCSLFGLETFQIQNLGIFLFFIFMLPLIYILGVEIFNYSKNFALILTILVGLNIHLFYIVYQGFFGQIIGMGYFYGLLFILLYPIIKNQGFRETIATVPFSILLFIGLWSSYETIIPLLIGPYLLFCIIQLFHTDSIQIFNRNIFYVLLVIFLSFVIYPFSIYERLQKLISFKDVIAGWDMPILTPDWILGIVGNNYLFRSEIPYIWIILSISMMIIFYFSIRSQFKDNFQLFIISLIYLGSIICLYLFLIIKEFLSPDFSGDGYRAYKLMTYFIPLFILTFYYFFRENDWDFNKPYLKKSNFFSIIFLVLTISTVLSGSMMALSGDVEFLSIDSSIIDLNTNPEVLNLDSINIETQSYWEQMWIHYFLFDKLPVYLKYQTYYKPSSLISNWTLKRNNNEKDIFDFKEFGKKPDIEINDKYSLKNNGSFEVIMGDGWYNPEYITDSTWRWSGKNNISPSLIIVNHEGNSFINLFLSYFPLNPINSLSIYRNGMLIKNCPDNFCSITNISLNHDTNKIIFQAKIPPEQPNSGDTRDLGFAFTRITVEKFN